MEKIHLTYQDIHNTVKDLSHELDALDFEPDYILAIGTGGFIPARILKTFVNKPIITVGIAYYDLDGNTKDSPVITQWLDEPEHQIKGKRILVVDEVDDTRTTIGFCLNELQKHNPEELALFVLHNKKKPKVCPIPPFVKHYLTGIDFEDQWICYPWDNKE